MSDHAEEEENEGLPHVDDLSLLRRHSISGSRLSRRPTFQQPITEPVNYVSLVCGLLAGVAQAGVFNPYDRALYLSIKDNRPFLHQANWQNPYTGFAQSIGGRAVQGGLYFPVEHFFLRVINRDGRDYDPRLNFLVGTAAGALNAAVLNPISAVKYKTWGRDVNRGMLHETVGMLRNSGSLRPFFNGMSPTVARDVVFGGTYTWLRLQIHDWFNLSHGQQWMGNFVAAAMATVMSRPFTYVRTLQFATQSHEKAASTVHILRDLTQQTVAQEGGILERLRFLQNKLRIGWGTTRVAMGMTFAHSVYDWLHENLNPHFKGIE